MTTLNCIYSYSNIIRLDFVGKHPYSNCHTMKHHRFKGFLTVSIGHINSKSTKKCILSFFLLYFLSQKINGVYSMEEKLVKGILNQLFSYQICLDEAGYLIFLESTRRLKKLGFSKKLYFSRGNTRTLGNSKNFSTTFCLFNYANSFLNINPKFNNWQYSVRVSLFNEHSDSGIFSDMYLDNLIR